MEELKNKSDENEKEDLLQDNISEYGEEINEIIYSNSFDNNNNNVFKRFNIYFYLNIFNDNIYIFDIKTDIFDINKKYVYNLIQNIVKVINEKKFKIKYNSIDYIISLKDIEDEENIDFYIKNYELKPCKKKNNFPKFDSPSYSSTSLLKNIENENISFISKNLLNIMLIKNEKNEEELSSKYQIDDDEEEEKEILNVFFKNKF